MDRLTETEALIIDALIDHCYTVLATLQGDHQVLYLNLELLSGGIRLRAAHALKNGQSPQ